MTARALAKFWESTHADRAIAIGLALFYFVLLLASAAGLGYARDEGFYFAASRAYAAWFELLFRDPAAAVEASAVDRVWVHNHEHPALMKSLFALSHWLFSERYELLDPGTAHRVAGMGVSSIAIGVVYAWGRRALGSRVAGLLAALFLGAMPRVFFHAHLACFDMPVAALFVATAYAYARSAEHGGVGWPLATGVLYGLLLDTKHNAWLLPPALVLHALLLCRARAFRDLARGRVVIPRALLAMVVIGPLVFYAGWPWLWRDTAARFADYVAFHTGHEYYNMEFWGHTYWQPPMPLGYAWVMTIATVPAVTLAAFVFGAASVLSHGLRARLLPGAGRLYASRLRGTLERWRLGPLPAGLDARRRYSTELLWLLGVAVSYAPWLRDTTPIFGGTKHWMTAYPFMALLAARGVERALALAVSGWKRRRAAAATAGVVAAAAAAPLVSTVQSHPWGLSAYAPLVGGAPGAASLGLNRTFWGYTTGAAESFLNEHAPPNARVYVHDTALQSWDMLQRDGRLRSDLVGTLSIVGSSLSLYHHEQHMQRVEHQIWVDYGTAAPSYVGTFQGVPVIWVYERPRVAVMAP